MTSFSNFKSRIVKESSEAADPANQVSSGAGTTEYATTLDMPTSGIDIGSMGFIAATNSLYVWTGTSWFNIATTNQAPTAITGGNSSYQLDTDGTPIVVTLVSSDPEGFPLTWSATTSGDTQVGTLTQADNVFTVTPSTSEADIGTLSVTFSVTDGNNTETAVSLFTLAFTSPLWDDTVLSIGTSDAIDNSVFVDRSTNAHTVTPTGSPVQTAFHPYLDKWSVEFDGSNYFTAPSHTSFDIGTGDFTFECWVYKETNNRIMLQAITGAGLSISINTSGNIEVNRTQTAIDFTFTAGIVSNTWTHIAVTRSGTDLRAFKDGVLLGTQTSTTDYGQGVCYVGVDGNGTSSRYIGFISDFRLIKGTAVYTSAFTPPTEKLTAVSGTSLLTCQSNRFIDNSSNAHAITPAGNVKVSAFNPFGQGSEYAPGENNGSGYLFENNLVVPHSSNLNLAGNDFTISCWVYLTEYPGTYSGSGAASAADILAKDTLNGREWLLGLSGTSTSYTTISLTLFTSNATPVGISASYNFKLFNWYHISVVRNGASTRIYVDGADIGGGNSANPQSTATELTIGAQGAYWRGVGYQYWFRGYIADLRLALNQVDYTTNFTPPTAPVGNTNASLYLPMDNAGIYDKTGNNTLTLFGDTSTSNIQTKYANTTMYFDGTGDYITVNNIANVGYSDFTAECWLYSVSGNDKGIIETRSSSNGTDGFTVTTFNDGVIRVWSNGALISTSGLTYRNTWVHVAVVRNSGTWQLFINGTSIGTNAASINLTNPTMYIGAGIYQSGSTVGAFLNGYIEDFQFLVGIAKYTANFTPPNRTQGRMYQAES